MSMSIHNTFILCTPLPLHSVHPFLHATHVPFLLPPAHTHAHTHTQLC
jgi:hypothetical protein